MMRFITGLVFLLALLVACNGSGDAEPAQPEPEMTAPPPPPAATAPTWTPDQCEQEGNVMEWNAPPELSIDAGKKYLATMRTNKGVIEVELFAGETPNAVNNFVFLACQGFYNGTPFHRVIKGFMMQGGDPTGTGTGGPGYRFNDEPVTRNYVRGILAMANAGPNTNGSQFFIMHQNYALPKNYVIFGQVTEGLDVVDAIANTPVRQSATGEPSVPTEPLTIESVEVREE